MPQPTTKFLKLKIRRGLGLIETLVGVGVLVGAICVLISMVVSASASRISNEYATIAANLAREGIEVVVAKRNDNWINDLAFDDGMNTVNDYTFGLAFEPSTSVWTFYDAPNAIGDATARIYKYTSGAPSYVGLMVQGSSQPSSTAITQYSRLISLDPICSTGSNESNELIVTSGSNCGANVKIGVRITSLVRWIDRGTTHSVSAIETIYDWR